MVCRQVIYLTISPKLWVRPLGTIFSLPYIKAFDNTNCMRNKFKCFYLIFDHVDTELFFLILFLESLHLLPVIVDVSLSDLHSIDHISCLQSSILFFSFLQELSSATIRWMINMFAPSWNLTLFDIRWINLTLYYLESTSETMIPDSLWNCSFDDYAL